MNVFPFTIDVPELENREDAKLPIFKELAYNYEKNCLMRKGGKPYLAEKDEALQIWIYKALKTRRFVYPAYTHTYGSEVENVIGISNDPAIIDSEIKRYITEALMVNPYLQELSDFTFHHKKDVVHVSFLVTTVYGRFTHESEVYNE